MQYLRTRGMALHFRFGALILVFDLLLLVGSAGAMIYAYLLLDRQVGEYAAYGLLIGVLLLVVGLLMGNRAHCPLCRMPVLGNKRCAKHRKAGTFFGSHRLRVALAILFTNSFRCPYCMAPTTVRARDRRDAPGNDRKAMLRKMSLEGPGPGRNPR